MKGVCLFIMACSHSVKCDRGFHWLTMKCYECMSSLRSSMPIVFLMLFHCIVQPALWFRETDELLMHKQIKWLVTVRSTLTWLLWEGEFLHLSTRYEVKVRDQGRGETLTAPLYDRMGTEHLSVSQGFFGSVDF